MAEKKNIIQASQRSRLVATLLCLFLGWAGAHRFYARKTGTGIFMLFTMGGFGLWWFIDCIMIASGQLLDKDGNAISNWT
jgi:TM2 domain-containing membrane protein YozV